MNIMHEIYGRANFQGFWQLVASVLFAILLLATIYLSMAVVVTGNWFFRLLGQLLDLEGLVEQFAIWQWVKYLLLLSLVFLFILLLYRFAAPCVAPDHRWCRGAGRRGGIGSGIRGVLVAYGPFHPVLSRLRLPDLCHHFAAVAVSLRQRAHLRQRLQLRPL